MKEHGSPERSYDLERLIFFTDGVFAIVITLLVIELRPPDDWDGSVSGLVTTRLNAFIAYAITFAATGAFWNAHRLLFGRVMRFHRLLVPLNLLFLGLVVLLPFAAQLIVAGGAGGEPFSIYLSLIAAIALSQATLWAAAIATEVIDPRYRGRPAAVIALLQLATPLLFALVGLLIGGGAPTLTWLALVPVIILLSFLRRRTLARVDRHPSETLP